MSTKLHGETRPHLASLVGHETLRRTWEARIASGTLPAVLLLHGPSGSGKERLALWLAQRLRCVPVAAVPADTLGLFAEAAPAPAPVVAQPCGGCPDCTQTAKLMHPDVSLYMPHPTWGKPDPDGRAYDAYLGAERARYLAPDVSAFLPRPSGVRYSLQVARAIAHEIRSFPSSGGRRVVILADVDRLVAQDGREESAATLLKLTEEPPAHTTIVMTTSRLHDVLPTIRSRAAPVPVAPLEAAEVTRLLTMCDLSRTLPMSVETAVRIGRGSLARAAQLLSDDGSARAAAQSLLTTLLAGSPVEQSQWVASCAGARLRDRVRDVFEEAAELTFDALLAAHEDPRVADGAWARPFVERLGRRQAALRLATVGAALEEAIEAVAGNANPLLVADTLVARVRDAARDVSSGRVRPVSALPPSPGSPIVAGA